MIPVIYLLAFSGGFVIMSLELLGGRILAPYFGSGIYVWGSIITIFMLSLSIGYLLGGRLSVHNPSSSRFAAIFAVAALLLLPLTVYAQALMEFIFLRVEDPRYGSLIASIVLFGLPTVILGMISPYSVRLLVDNVAESGRVAGALYFVSTLGSAIGTLMTSFYFVLWFEMNTIITLLISCLALLAVLAFTADRFLSK
ncbi:MAG TPA: glycosyl transferase [Gammaproteobacteria bacterium]|nr:glycosyl transferase [Gammaproteobacteria bacterium]HCY04283.1 glycosyl transferase [Gammaproteobacteria bacterium]